MQAEEAQVEVPGPSGTGEGGRSAGRTDRAESGQAGPPGEDLAHGGITRLRWLAIVLPLAFIAGLNYLLHTGLSALHDFPGVLAVLAALAAGIAAFSYTVFALVARLERRILERNAMLAALVAIGREAGSSLDLGELLDNSLDAVLRVTFAEAAEVWLEEGGAGEPVLARQRGEAPADAFRERLPLRHRGETYGVLCVAARDRKAMRDDAERGLLEGVAERLAVAIENSRLHERVLDAAVLDERERIARELHDGLAQVLGYINTQTLAVRKLLDSGRSEEAGVHLEAMEQAAKRVYADVREGILSLREPLGESDRLADAVRAHLRSYREMPGAPAELSVVEEEEVPKLPPPTEIQLVWIVQEALTNVRNHAGAGSAAVRFSLQGSELVVAVEDDGRGFEPQRRARTGWPHFGLQTMRERAEAIGGRFEIASEPGRGTAVRVRVPLSRADGEGGGEG